MAYAAGRRFSFVNALLPSATQPLSRESFLTTLTLTLTVAQCGIAVLVGLALAAAAIRRTAAVGRVEMTILFLMYAVVQGLQLADNSALLKQGSLALTWCVCVPLLRRQRLRWGKISRRRRSRKAQALT